MDAIYVDLRKMSRKRRARVLAHLKNFYLYEVVRGIESRFVAMGTVNYVRKKGLLILYGYRENLDAQTSALKLRKRDVRPQMSL